MLQHMPFLRFCRPAALVLGIIVSLGLMHPSYAGNIKISAASQLYRPFAGQSVFDGGVQVHMKDATVSAGHAEFQLDNAGKPNQANFNGNAHLQRKMDDLKQTIDANTLSMGLQSGSLEAKGKVSTKISGDKDLGNVSIQSDTQVFDQQKGIMRAIGHVAVKKDNMTAQSPEAIIFLGANGSAEKVVFVKGARLTQGEQDLTAETITINITTGDIFAEKNAKSTVMGKDSDGTPTQILIQSHLQEINNQTGTLLANGNAVIDYGDYIAKGPKAVFYRNTTTKDLDKIVLSGRAMIEDLDRKVTGDTVIITVNPRQFNAQGNVTTFIKSKSGKPASGAAPTPSKDKVGKSATGNKLTAAKTRAPRPTSQPMDQELLIEETVSNTTTGAHAQ